MPFAFVVAVVVTVAPVRISLAVAAGSPLSSAAVEGAVAEAAAIWQPYCVSIGTGRPAQPDEHALVLRVAFSTASGDGASPWQGPLGAVEFGGDGTPGHVITVFLGRLLFLLEGQKFSNVLVERWPGLVHDTIVGRAVGRVVAHEIGHILLRTKAHAARGLMRATHYAADLIEPQRTRYRLQ